MRVGSADAGAALAHETPVAVGIEGPLGVVSLDNPPLNLLTLDMRSRLRLVAERLGADARVRAVVVASAVERSFCAGSDIREFGSAAAAGRRQAAAENACNDAIEAMPQPTVAALRGHVLGGGLELALACDLRVAAEDSVLGMPETGLGVFPWGGGTRRLPRLIGPARAKELVLLGDPIDADEALRLGLVNRVVPPDEVDAVARDLAVRLASRPRLAVQASKRAIDAGLYLRPDAARRTEAEEVAQLFESHDMTEGRTALLDKREPRFEHR